MMIRRLSLLPLAILTAAVVNVTPLSVTPALCQAAPCPEEGEIAADGTYTGEYEYLISFEGDMGGMSLVQVTLASADLAVEVARGVIDGAGIAAQESRNIGQVGDITASSEMTQRWTGSFDVAGRAERGAELEAVGDMNPGTIVATAEGITLEYEAPGGPIDMLLIVREVGCGEISGEVGGNYVSALDEAVQTLVGTAPDVETNRWQLTLEGRDEALEAEVEDAIAASRQGEPVTGEQPPLRVEVVEEEITLEEAGLRVEIVEGEITIEEGEPGLQVELVEGEITMEESGLHVEVVEGEITIEEGEPGLQVELVEDDITLEESGLHVEIVEGEITIEEGEPGLQVELVEGEISMEESGLHVEVVEGEITLADTADDKLQRLLDLAHDLQNRPAAEEGGYFYCLGERAMVAARQLMVRRVESLLRDFPSADAPSVVVREAAARLLGEYRTAVVLLATPEECLDQLPGWDRVGEVVRERFLRDVDTTTDLTTILLIARMSQLLGTWDAELDARLGGAITRILGGR